jgi:hypothetical protein
MPVDLGRIIAPTEDIILAVSLCAGTHVGVVYRNRQAIRFLHFAFMHDLREDDFAPRRMKYVCVQPNFLDATLRAIAGWFRRIYALETNRNTIPYNLIPNTGADFDPDTAAFIAGPGGGGFTCATFVVRAFRCIGNPILETTGWSANRPGDEDRQRQLIEMLRQNGFTDWADRVERTEFGCPRIAPEEVAGACLEDVLTSPATYKECEPNGRLLLAVLDWQKARYS